MMSDGIHDDLSSSDLKDRSMRRLASEAIVDFAQLHRECGGFTRDAVPFGILLQRLKRSFESIQPSCCLFDGAMLRPPEGVIS